MINRLLHGGAAADDMAQYMAYTAESEYVSLDAIEYKSAVYTGRLIWNESQARGLRDYHGSKEGGAAGVRWQELGAVAERAVAKWLRVYWGGGYNSFRGPDLLNNVEVRLIGKENYGLRVRDTDANYKYVVGVVIPFGRERQRYRLPGYILAAEAKAHKEWLMNPYDSRPFYGVPQANLQPMRYLLSVVPGRALIAGGHEGKKGESDGKA